MQEETDRVQRAKENLTVVSQEEIGNRYFQPLAADRSNGSSMHGRDSSFLYIQEMAVNYFRRPISICEIDKENGRIRLVYRVTGKDTGTEAFSQTAAGMTRLKHLDLLEMDFRLKKLKAKKYF